MTTVPNGISVSMQYEHTHTILHKPFFISMRIDRNLCQCERSLTETDEMARVPNGINVSV